MKTYRGQIFILDSGTIAAGRKHFSDFSIAVLADTFNLFLRLYKYDILRQI